MDYGFTQVEVIFIYGRLSRELSQLEKLKAPKKELKLYASILEKLSSKHPQLKQLSRQ